MWLFFWRGVAFFLSIFCVCLLPPPISFPHRVGVGQPPTPCRKEKEGYPTQTHHPHTAHIKLKIQTHKPNAKSTHTTHQSQTQNPIHTPTILTHTSNTTQPLHTRAPTSARTGFAVFVVSTSFTRCLLHPAPQTLKWHRVERKQTQRETRTSWTRG